MGSWFRTPSRLSRVRNCNTHGELHTQSSPAWSLCTRRGYSCSVFAPGYDPATPAEARLILGLPRKGAARPEFGIGGPGNRTQATGDEARKPSLKFFCSAAAPSSRLSQQRGRKELRQ